MHATRALQVLVEMHALGWIEMHPPWRPASGGAPAAALEGGAPAAGAMAGAGGAGDGGEGGHGGHHHHMHMARRQTGKPRQAQAGAQH